MIARRPALLGIILAALLACKKPSGSDRYVEATDNRSRIQIPGRWKELTDLNDKADIQVGQRANAEFLIVLTEPKADFVSMDAARYLDHHLSKLETALTTPRRVPLETKQVGSYSARQAELHGVLENLNLVYLVTAIEGPKCFHGVIAWTTKGRWSEARPAFDKAVSSFQEK